MIAGEPRLIRMCHLELQSVKPGRLANPIRMLRLCPLIREHCSVFLRKTETIQRSEGPAQPPKRRNSRIDGANGIL